MKKLYFIITITLISSLLITCAPSKNTPPYYSETYVNKTPNLPKAYSLEQRARQKASENENKQAILIFTKIIHKYKHYSHLYRVLTGRAISYHKLLKFKKARLDYKKAIKLYPHYINAWVGLGLLFKHVGNLQKAKSIFLKCIEIMPDKKENFILMINRLKPFSKAFFSSNGIVYEYDFMKMNFYFKLSSSFKIKTTSNPFTPYLIEPNNSNDKTKIHIIVMNFSSLSRFRFLTFKQRAKRWINLEKALFQKLFRKKIKLKDIKETDIGNKHCAYINFEVGDNKYGIIFFFRKSFGIMTIIKTNKNKYVTKLPLLHKIIHSIRFKQ